MTIADVNLTPGIGSEYEAEFRRIFWSENGKHLLPTGVVVDGTKSRDPGNTGYTDTLRAGMLLGKITATGKYAPSVIGVTTVAYTPGASTVTVGLAAAAELVRRIGTSGTFTLTGPAVASGTVRSATVTYSAVDTATGIITVTAMTSTTSADSMTVVHTTPGVTLISAVSAANEVQTITPASAVSNGNVTLTVTDYQGTVHDVKVAYDANAATITTALNAALGTSAVAVAGNFASTVAVTFSGTHYADLPQSAIKVDWDGATQATAGGTVAHTTVGVAAVAETPAVNEVQTITFGGTPTAGTFRIGFRGAWTDAIPYNVSTATLQATLRALSSIAGAYVTVSGTAATSYVVTFISSLAGQPIELLTLDPSGLTGVTAAFVSASFVQPTDGSQTICTLVGKEDGLKVTDRIGTSASVQASEVPIGGMIDPDYIVSYTGSDASLKAWVKAALRAVGIGYVFRDDFTV